MEKVRDIFVAAILWATLLTAFQACGQNFDKNSTTPFAGSLRDLCGYSAEGHEYSFNTVLCLYYKIETNMLDYDPELKMQLIRSFLTEAEGKGYKLPRKIRNADPFDPYNYILDLHIYYNRAGYIIPLNDVDIKYTIIGNHDKKVVFHHDVD